VVVPFALGAGWAILSGFATAKAMFVAAAFVATSAGITAKVLQELGILNSTAARVILGAAVIDDVLAMLLLGAVSALQTDKGVNIMNLLTVFAGAVGFVALVSLAGTYLMRKTSGILDAPLDSESPLTISFALCLVLAVASAHVGLAAIIGAFLAGMVLAETPHRKALEHDFARVSAVLVPFFFVVTGAHVNVQLLGTGSVLVSVLIVTVLAIIGKVVGCGLGARSLKRKEALVVGVGMVPRGEVGVIVAGLGSKSGVFTPTMYAIIIGMSLLTSVVAPPVLKMLVREPKPGDTPIAEPPPEADGSDG
jgi:Kef-type K+ transport system membrane component KefB